METCCRWSSRFRNRSTGKAEKLAKKISKGKSFDLMDLRDQLTSCRKWRMSALLDKLPAQLQANAAAAAGQVNQGAESARWASSIP